MRVKSNLLKRFNLICPVQTPLQKYFCLRLTQITCVFPSSRPERGALAIVTDVGAGSGGRGCAFDEQRVKRTAKSCGPDAPVAGVKLRGGIRATTVTNKPGLAGESTK